MSFDCIYVDDYEKYIEALDITVDVLEELQREGVHVSQALIDLIDARSKKRIPHPGDLR